MLRYLGWCPGFNKMAYYLPDTEYRVNIGLALTFAALFFGLFTVIAANFYQPIPINPNGPLQIYIGYGGRRDVIYDSDFNQTFDYSIFYERTGKGPYFEESCSDADFAKGLEIEVNTYMFSTLDEVYNFTLQLNMPNCIRQYIRWLVAQDFNTTYQKVFGEIPPRDHIVFGNNMGSESLTYGTTIYGVRYYIIREAYIWFGGFAISYDYKLVLMDGVSVEKFDSVDDRWYLGIDAGFVYYSKLYPSLGEPYYRVRLVRYPVGNHKMHS
jgi:hypothetical protein